MRSRRSASQRFGCPRLISHRIACIRLRPRRLWSRRGSVYQERMRVHADRFNARRGSRHDALTRRPLWQCRRRAHSDQIHRSIQRKARARSDRHRRFASMASALIFQSAPAVRAAPVSRHKRMRLQDQMELDQDSGSNSSLPSVGLLLSHDSYAWTVWLQHS